MTDEEINLTLPQRDRFASLFPLASYRFVKKNFRDLYFVLILWSNSQLSHILPRIRMLMLTLILMKTKYVKSISRMPQYPPDRSEMRVGT